MNARENEAFAELVRDALPKYQESIDMGLYKSRSNLRILNCYKVEREIIDGLSTFHDNGKVNVTRQKRALFPETLTLSQSLVSYTTGLTMLTTKLAKDKPIVEYKQVNCEYNLENINNMLSDDDRRSFVYRSTTNNIINYNRLVPSYCELCSRVHDKDNTLYIMIYNDSKAVVKGCLKCDSKKVIGSYDSEIIVNECVSHESDNELDYIIDDLLDINGEETESNITDEENESEYEFECEDCVDEESISNLLGCIA